MPNRHLESTAASLLSSWTDSDTAMQIVGTSIGVFGPGLLDPTVVLSRETPLRNALFDVLLSLVEGGALDVRPTEDAGYAFRFRTDFATAALDPGTSQAIDIDTPNPYLDELIQARRERDEALGRADFAEALAAERERLLRLGDTPRATRPVRRRVPAPRAGGVDTVVADDEIDLTAIEAEEAERAPLEAPVEATIEAPVQAPVEATIEAPANEPVTVAAVPEAVPSAPTEPIVAVESAPELTVEPEVEVAPEPEPEVAPIAAAPAEPELVAGLPPAPVIASAPPEETLVGVDASPEPEAQPVDPVPKKVAAKKTVAKKAPQKKAAPKKRAAKKPAAKPAAAAVTDARPEPAAPEIAVAVEPEPAEIAMPEQAPSEVVYLTPPAPPEPADADPDDEARVVAADEATTRRAKWSGYTLDKPRAHLSSVDRIADDG